MGRDGKGDKVEMGVRTSIGSLILFLRYLSVQCIMMENLSAAGFGELLMVLRTKLM